ncbi:carbohydrate ABC transporter permease [Ruania zhangjianzhongii]|uniref:carbohydrate ABC transporter permease n=1 Tax=Ruania zhangjianzhongii TaxID=2603206 RepID=UPI0011CA47F4|nr:sugar ABC transporter permease [Ruania zhangjianzhongii]
MTAPNLTAGRATPARPDPDPAPARVRRSRRSLRDLALVWGFAAPALVVYIGFVIVPVALAAVFSFFNWNGLGPLERFIGFENYVRAFSDPVFLGALRNNVVILVLSLAIQGPLAIGIALLLNRKLRGRTLIRTLIFVPYVLSEVVAGLAFRLMLPPEGPVDGVLTSLGWSGPKPQWLADPDIAFWTLFAVLTWKYLGLAIILMLAGLQGIPEELHEAAALDGASWWQTQRRITIPLLGPTVRIWAFLSMIGSLQLFDMVWILTGGGPLNATQTMATYMVDIGNGRSQIGFGSAVAVILFLISLVIALIYQRAVLRRDMVGAVTGRG